MKKCMNLIFFVLGLFSSFVLKAQERSDFENPPLCYGPYVWWHWAGPNFSERGITKDLEAMKASGIGGATIFNITSAVQETHAPMFNNPWPEKTYRSEAYWRAVTHAAKEAERLGIELGIHNTVGYSTTGGPWISEEKGMQCVVMTSVDVCGGRKIEIKLKQGVPPIYKGWGTFKKKAKRYNEIAVIALPMKKGNIKVEDVINLSKYMDTEGKLRWNAPVGTWRIYRIGYAATMSNPHPVPDDLMGNVLEVDKMNEKHNAYHWNKVLRPLQKYLGKYLGQSFKHILIDSYEAGKQNWTKGFEVEFEKLKGYNPVPWLTGCLGTEEERARFQYDYDDVISFMYYKYGFKLGADMIHKYKMILQFEPYGGPFDTYLCTSLADIPMGEFWTHSLGGISQSVVSSARAEGKHIIAAEAFTSRPERSAWTEDPEFLKKSADGAFCSGVNRLVLHHWVHQPFDEKYQPGLSMGWWGTHFNRYQTWFEPGKAFFKYLSRIQYMLQQGEEVVDYLCLDEVRGHADAISSRRLLDIDIKVENGRIVLPSGRSYAFMVCPKLRVVTPEVVEKLLNLSRRGAVIVGESPQRSPSLEDYPVCDEKVVMLGRKIKLFASIEDAMNYTKSFSLLEYNVSKDSVMSVVRKTDKGYIVFLANRTASQQRLFISTLFKDFLPELWNPETGNIRVSDSWKQTKDKNTKVNLLLNPNETMFVVFKNRPTDKQIVENTGTMLPLKKIATQKISGEWTVDFYPKLEKNFTKVFHQLADFKYSTDKRIMYFSGTAIYNKQIRISKDIMKCNKIILSLGKLNDIARVVINGKDAGVWWYSPYQKDIKSYLQEGKNTISIEVTTNWANRLIGDEKEPADFEFGIDRGNSLGRAMKAYPDWFVKDEKRPADRKAFVIWYYYNRDSELQPAGLVGPVSLECFN